MASIPAETEKGDGGLKYLGFARLMAINTMICVSNLYNYAKQNSGPLKSTVGIAEKAVTTVVGPVYEKIKGVPDDALGYLDTKVGKAVSKFDDLAPPLAKSVVSATQQVVHKAAETSQEMVQEAEVAGPRSAIFLLATMSKNFVAGHLPVLLYQVNRFPVINSVAEKVIPTAAFYSGKYNSFVMKLSARGYHFFSYFPLVPVEAITKAFKKVDGVSSAERLDRLVWLCH